ncbi:MAG: hypothetical protein KAJ19_05080 [Gammaproteobacteria bacterium]|nr:hypothetical protein [Gammaproteobacteria bacterium]
MVQIENLKATTDLANARLQYFSDVKQWCDAYLARNKKAQMDTVRTNQTAENDIMALRDRMTELITQDAMEAASYSLDGEFSWMSKPPTD